MGNRGGLLWRMAHVHKFTKSGRGKISVRVCPVTLCRLPRTITAAGRVKLLFAIVSLLWPAEAYGTQDSLSENE